jgi:hypothetical protein
MAGVSVPRVREIRDIIIDCDLEIRAKRAK